MKDKITLGIQQRIPLNILYETLVMELQGNLDVSRLRELLLTEYQGENRIKKTIGQITSIIRTEGIQTFLKENAKDILHAITTSKVDRDIILIALINMRYTFCYDVTVALAAQFRLQDQISAELLDRLIGKKYGMNKSTLNSRNCAVPQLIEAGFVRRPQTGVLEAVAPLVPLYSISSRLWQESFYLNNLLWSQENTEDLMFEPYFKYLNF